MDGHTWERVLNKPQRCGMYGVRAPRGNVIHIVRVVPAGVMTWDGMDEMMFFNCEWRRIDRPPRAVR